MPAFLSKLLASKSPYTIPRRMRKIFFVLPCLFFLALLSQAGNVHADVPSEAELALKGSAEAQYYIAQRYYAGQDYKSAAVWLQRAAEQGLAEAQDKLGFMYYKGKGVRQNKVIAAKWYEKAAEKGFAPSQYDLGMMYAKGEGVAKDYCKASQWYQKAAEQGLTKAQFQLGLSYGLGNGVIRDRQKGCGLIRSAAEQGDKEAIEAYNKVCAD